MENQNGIPDDFIQETLNQVKEISDNTFSELVAFGSCSVKIPIYEGDIINFCSDCSATIYEGKEHKCSKS